MEPFLGEIKMWGGNFAPRGFAFCNGQLLSIAQNTALFSLLGTTYGGNGQTTFGLPNLQCRIPMHWGSGGGLTPRTLGEVSGTESVNLTTLQIPAHIHPLLASNAQAGNNKLTPQGNFIAVPTDPNSGTTLNAFSATANEVMNPTAVGTAGGSQPHDNMPPYLCVSFIIALEGIFPSRN